MIDKPNAGTACAHCRKLGHFCRAVIAMDGVPYCDSCYDDLECEAIKAHRVRITGLGGEERGTLSGPVKQVELSHEQRKPFTDMETKSTWLATFERRSAEDAKKPRLRVTGTAIEAGRVGRPRTRKPAAPIRHCACGNRMKGGNKKETCNACSQKNRYKRVNMRQCKHPDCLEKINSRNTLGLCRWHNPNNIYRSKYKNTQPKMMEEAA